LSRAVRALPVIPVSRPGSLCGVFGWWGVGGGVWRPGGRGVFVNWIVDASI
jgi:hypothetical protein